MRGQLHAPVTLPPGKAPVLPTEEGAWWAPQVVGWAPQVVSIFIRRENLPPVMGIEVRTVQPAAFFTPRIFIDLSVCCDVIYVSSAELVQR